MSSSIGERLKISIFGQSHGKAIGVLMEGLPPGEHVDEDELRAFMARRQGGRGEHTTARKEADIPIFLSGLLGNKTTGEPLCAIIENKNTKSDDYAPFSDTPRPSHADYPASVKYSGFNDLRGGGHFSGRLTAPLCVAGAIAKQVLAKKGINIGAHISEIACVTDTLFDPVSVNDSTFTEVAAKIIPVIDDFKGELMLKAISDAAAEDDSVGGIIECAAIGLPAGLGEPIFDGIENRISAMVFALGGVRGIEFGAGFSAARMRGSKHNDPFYISGGEIKTRTNNHGGALGGLSTAMPVLFRVAFKPTASISQRQQTVNLKTMEPANIEINGRHDPCIVPRAAPCVEAVAAVSILDFILLS